jgi:Ca-activated chloride channel family protein
MSLLFASPYFLALLVLIPCFFWCKVASPSYYFTKLSWLSPHSQVFAWETWLKLVIFSLMVLALGKPFLYNPHDNQHKKGRDLVLALDASGSMGERGFDANDRLKNKFELSISLSKSFIKKRYDDNMGVVVFGTFAYTASPLTYDLASLSYLLDFSDIGMAGDSTAIGDALSQSIKTLSFGDAKSKAIILLTDGYHNAGKVSPKQSVALAKEKEIKIYTIGIGKKSQYDVSLLQAIAKETGAKSYTASTASDLEAIYSEIHSLEPSAIRSEAYLNQNLLISYPLFLVFILLSLWVIWEQREIS